MVDKLELARLLYPHGREAEWERISALAGVGPDDSLLPPPGKVEGIDRSPSTFWRNQVDKS